MFIPVDCDDVLDVQRADRTLRSPFVFIRLSRVEQCVGLRHFFQRELRRQPQAVVGAVRHPSLFPLPCFFYWVRSDILAHFCSPVTWRRSDETSIHMVFIWWLHSEQPLLSIPARSYLRLPSLIQLRLYKLLRMVLCCRPTQELLNIALETIIVNGDDL